MNEALENISNQSRVEAALLSSSLVRECKILTRTTTRSERVNIAYLVPIGNFVQARIEEYLQATLPNAQIPSHFVPLYSLPRDKEGKVDEGALLSLEVISPELIDRW